MIFPLKELKQANNSRIPLVTLSLAALMVLLTNLWSVGRLCIPFSATCSPDPHTPLGVAELAVWLAFGPFVHVNLVHLVTDLVGFLFVGSLLEVWVTHIQIKTRYRILLVGYVASLVLNLLAFSWKSSVAGSSVWCYSLLAVPIYYWMRFHNETRRSWSSLILCGLGLTLVPLGYTIFQGRVFPTLNHLWGVYYGVFVSAYMLRKTGFR